MLDDDVRGVLKGCVMCVCYGQVDVCVERGCCV